MIEERPSKILSFYEAIDKAEELLEVEKDHIKRAYAIGFYDAWYNVKHNDDLLYTDAEHYYKENHEIPSVKD